jgi:hypothetical protein
MPPRCAVVAVELDDPLPPVLSPRRRHVRAAAVVAAAVLAAAALAHGPHLHALPAPDDTDPFVVAERFAAVLAAGNPAGACRTLTPQGLHLLALAAGTDDCAATVEHAAATSPRATGEPPELIDVPGHRYLARVAQGGSPTVTLLRTGSTWQVVGVGD